MRKFSGLIIQFAFIVYMSSATAGSDEVKSIEILVAVPQSILELEALAKEHSGDTPEIKRKRSKLKESIESYKSVAKDVRKKYAGWIENEHKTQEIRKAVLEKKETEYSKIVVNYMQLTFYEVNGFFLSPHGTKGSMNEMTDSMRLDGMKMVVTEAHHELQETILNSMLSKDTSK